MAPMIIPGLFAALGGVLKTGLISAGTARITQALSDRPRTAPGFQPMGFAQGTQVASIAGTAGRVVGGASRIFRGAVGVIRSSTGKISGVRLGSGSFVSRKKVVSMARRVGIEATAVAIGITVADMAEMVVTAPVRRRRGISAADIRRTKRTLRKVCQITNQFAAVKTAKKACR